MHNPLENEDAAFRFVLGTIAYLTPIVLASWVAARLGFAVFVAATAVAVAVLRGEGRQPSTSEEPPARADVEDTWRILAVVDETLGGSGLQEVIIGLAEGVAEDVLVVCLLPPSPAPTGAAATVDVRAAAGERVRSMVSELTLAGVNARGEVFEGGPVAALEEALGRFSADEVVISTRAGARLEGLDQTLVDAARSLFEGSVTHVVEPSGP